jgi:hypothetical protein
MEVSLSDVLIHEDGMFLHKNKQIVQISSLQFENGAYTATIPAGIAEDFFGTWWCYNCQNWNSKFDAACHYCGKPK